MAKETLTLEAPLMLVLTLHMLVLHLQTYFIMFLYATVKGWHIFFVKRDVIYGRPPMELYLVFWF